MLHPPLPGYFFGSTWTHRNVAKENKRTDE